MHIIWVYCSRALVLSLGQRGDRRLLPDSKRSEVRTLPLSLSSLLCWALDVLLPLMIPPQPNITSLLTTHLTPASTRTPSCSIHDAPC